MENTTPQIDPNNIPQPPQKHNYKLNDADITLLHMQGHTAAQIARALNCSGPAISKKLHQLFPAYDVKQVNSALPQLAKNRALQILAGIDEATIGKAGLGERTGSISKLVATAQALTGDNKQANIVVNIAFNGHTGAMARPVDDPAVVDVTPAVQVVDNSGPDDAIFVDSCPQDET